MTAAGADARSGRTDAAPAARVSQERLLERIASVERALASHTWLCEVDEWQLYEADCDLRDLRASHAALVARLPELAEACVRAGWWGGGIVGTEARDSDTIVKEPSPEQTKAIAARALAAWSAKP